ncbi:hypothetical protein ERO13_D05G041950v2 [Gossypium hirsutum]|nr:hypothetical protein ERO13_D05G041950v2 [Gossypium hirsutum]
MTSINDSWAMKVPFGSKPALAVMSFHHVRFLHWCKSCSAICVHG